MIQLKQNLRKIAQTTWDSECFYADEMENVRLPFCRIVSPSKNQTTQEIRLRSERDLRWMCSLTLLPEQPPEGIFLKVRQSVSFPAQNLSPYLRRFYLPPLLFDLLSLSVTPLLLHWLPCHSLNIPRMHLPQGFLIVAPFSDHSSSIKVHSVPSIRSLFTTAVHPSPAGWTPTASLPSLTILLTLLIFFHRMNHQLI